MKFSVSEKIRRIDNSQIVAIVGRPVLLELALIEKYALMKQVDKTKTEFAITWKRVAKEPMSLFRD